MRNMKKFLALVLAMLMITSMAVMTTSAADEADYTEAAQNLAALKVMKGDENGNLMLDQGVKRYQASLFFAQALTAKTDAAVWNAEKKSVNFADVIEYGTAIDYAAGLNIVKGIGGNQFGYNNPIIYQDMIVMAVRALGYETADMQYPYGHILAADKLGLLEGIDIVNYKEELTRGATAQLIWNMLGTEIAVVDPLTDKVIYPGEEDASLAGALSENLANQLKNRETLLEKAGFASATLEAVIVEFIPADEDDEDSVDTLVIDYTYTETVEDEEVEYTISDVEIAAADLGITADTAKVTYLGLPVTLFVDCAAEDFEAEYADEEAAIVFADFAEYTVVKNDGSADNLKYVASNNPYISLGGAKFTDAKYYADAYVFDASSAAAGWTQVPSEVAQAIMAQFEYDSKDGYVCEIPGANTYGQVAYRVTDKTMTFEEDGEDVEKTCIEILYTPYAFAQYIERELKYNVTSENETFKILGQYTGSEYTTVENETTWFEETFVGSGSAVSKNVSKSKGEKALEVTVTGEAVESGDFMFYTYNALDNVLTVVKNCGTLETGRMTATNPKEGKETVKIGGTNYGFGFAGLFDEYTAYNNATVKAIIGDLEAGKDNVQYLAVDGNIVFMEAYEGAADAASYGFAIVTTASEIMAELLDTTVTKYEKALTGKVDGQFDAGLYLDDDYVVVAMLNTTTGEWELANIEAFALDYADLDETEDEDWDFTHYVDVATIASYTKITTTVNGINEYVTAANALTSANIFMVVEEDDGVYTLAAADETNEEGDLFVEYVTNADGLVFNTAGRTNQITASADVDAARVSTNENTVVVVIGKDAEGNDIVETRTGVQGTKKTINDEYFDDFTYANFYAADASLIVLTTDATVANWGTGSALASGTTYYVVMPDVAVEYGTTDNEEEYTLTIDGLFDLKTLEAAEPVVLTAETMDELEDVADLTETVGNVLFLNEDGTLEEKGAGYVTAALTALMQDVDDDYFAATVTEFIDGESITVKNGGTVVTDADNAIVEVNVNVVTLDLTGYDWDDANTDTMYVGNSVAFVEDAYEGISSIEVNGQERYNYVLDMSDVVAEISDPTDGVYDQFIIDMAGKNIKVQDADADEGVYENNYNFTVELNTVALYDDEAEVLTLYVVKIVK